jgi:uncharacterized protein (TIGR03086 family)
MDPLDLFDQGSAWTKEKIEGAKGGLAEATQCEGWDVRTLVSHLIAWQGFFQAAARGEQAERPPEPPPDVAGDDPAASYETARRATIAAFREPGALEKAGPTAGIAFVDQIVHGVDIAKATGQDATLPPDLADAAFAMVEGRLGEENRGSAFKPAVQVADDARTQDKLLAYLGRNP